MNKILVSGPDIATLAVRLAQDAGYELIFAPAYADSAALIDLIKHHNPIGIVSRAGYLRAETMAAGQSLKIVSKHGAGVDNIDVEAASQMGIQVIRATGANALSVAEHAVALTMGAVKKLRTLDVNLRAGSWEKMSFAGREMSGMIVGLVGAGAIANATARLFRGLGLTVVAYDPYASAETFAEMDVKRFTCFDDMLRQVNIVSLHCPLTPDTRHILNAEKLALLPAGSYVINAARGGLIDEIALLDALDSGQIAGAGLDVFETEPLGENSPLFKAKELIVTPHIGASTHAAMERVAYDAVQGIIDYVQGREIVENRLVNRIKR